MRSIYIKKRVFGNHQLLPVCLKLPQKHYERPPRLKRLGILLLLFLTFLIPFLLGDDPAPALFEPISNRNSSFFPPPGEEPIDLIQTKDGGFAFTLFAKQVILVKTDEFGSVLWNQKLTVELEYLRELIDDPILIQTIDGGFAFAYCHKENIMIKKMDFNGKLEWNQSYCFRTPPRHWNDFRLDTIIQTSDSGFVLLVNDMASGLPSENPKQIIVKTDEFGLIQWQKIFENTKSSDYPNLVAILQTVDIGLILVGLDNHISRTPGHTTAPNSTDIWLMKLDEFSNSVWNKSFQLVQDKGIYNIHIIQTSDSDFIITAGVDEYKMEYYHLDRSVNSWLIKCTYSGDLEWTIPLSLAAITAPIQTSDKDFVVAGRINSGWETTDYDNYDTRLVKVDYQGNLLWKKTFETRERNEKVVSLVQTYDQGFALTEFSPVSLTKLNATGEIQWRQRYDVAPKDMEWANTLVETSDKGFALAGTTSSYGTGPTDMWLIKTNKYGLEEYNHTFGGGGDEVANALVQTKEGDFVLVGSTTSFGSGQSDIWLVKTDPSGSIKWHRTYGTKGIEQGYYLEEPIDGGFAIMGISYANDTTPGEILLVKTDNLGVMTWNKTYEIPENLTFINPGTREFYGHNDHSCDVFYGKSTLTRIFSFTEANDGGYAICLFNYLFKTDKKGVIQWNRTLNVEYDPVLVKERREKFLSHNRICFTETADNGFIVGTTTETARGGWGYINCNYEGGLIKIDAEGTIQWTKKWEDRNTIEAVYPVDDGIISCIWSCSKDHLNISKLGLNGIWEWNKTVLAAWDNWDFFTWWDNPLDSILTSTGEYVLTGITGSCYPFYDAWLAFRDDTGTLLWEYTYGTTGGSWVFNTSFTQFLTSTCDGSTSSVITDSDQDLYTDQITRGFELIPLFVGGIIIKWHTKRKKVKIQ